jgi:uncharacterized protein
MSSIIKQEGFSYAFDSAKCAECGGRCCTGESGYIYLSRDEIEDIAAFLELSLEMFGQKYLFQKGYKYSLKERVYEGSHDCIFYDRKSNGCKIYAVRPKQCRTFPFWEYFKTRVDALKLECPGILDD